MTLSNRQGPGTAPGLN